ELSRGLRVLGGVTLLDAEQESTGTAATDGRKVIGVPSAQANLGVEWDVPGFTGLTLDSRLPAARRVDAADRNHLRAPGRGVVDVGMRYIADVAGKPVAFRLRVDNVADRDYWASAGGFAGAGYLVLGAPRTVMFSVSMDL